MSKKSDDPAKAEDKKKDKKGKKAKGSGDGAAGPSVATHPKASYQVRRAKGWGGIAGFALAAYLSYKAGVPPFDLGLRAIAAGIAGYMLAWACAVTVWLHLVLAELRAAAERAGALTHPDPIPARAPVPAQPAAAPSEVEAATAAAVPES